MALLSALALTACSSTGPVGAPSDGSDRPTDAEGSRQAPGGREAACEAAKDEGPLDWWTQDPATSERVISMFHEAYPDIEVTFTQLLENDIAQRLVAESTGHQGITADLVVGHTAAFQPLVERGLVDTSIEWPEQIDPATVSPTNMVRISRRVNGVVYNTDQYSPTDLPDTWEDLVDPRWRGKVSVHTTGIPFDVLAVAWGEEKTLDWARQLSDVVHPEPINGTTASIQAAASGEVPLALSGRDSEVKEQQAEGAPVDIKYLTPVPTFDFYQMIPTGAKDVNAAVCFATWYVSDARDEVLALSFASNDDVPPGLPADAEIVSVTPDDVDTLATVAPEVSEIWVNGS